MIKTKSKSSLFKSQEIQSNKGLKYPFNSYSSFIYLILLTNYYNKNINLFNFIGIFIIISLTISSYLWWGYRNIYIHKIDIISYSSIIFYLGFLILINNYESYNIKLYITILFIILIFFISFIVNNNYRFLIKITNIISVSFSTCLVLQQNLTFNRTFGLFLIFLSISLKICDTYYIIDFNKFKLCSGTGWFHIISGIGLHYLMEIN